ncbi:peroxiredoxin-like family protein [Deinococcus frigens]|uniref:peroxiredoxin-like family protein n=1 Tax=Deinococcus frigens TaxID=249403 RepID=UPI00068CAAB1|nr:peroxiredoxin-like family protein [Deinococcus frigens]
MTSQPDAISPAALMPRQHVPALEVPLVSGGRYTLGQQPGENFDLIVFYRGLHCPVCAKYLLELERLSEQYAARGVRIIAISSDTEDRARTMAEKVGAKGIEFGYDLDLDTARQWGLFISASRGRTSIGIEEPTLFSEPGVFLVRPDGTLYYGSVQTMPFARPPFDDLLGAVGFALDKTYPARGEYGGEV